MIIENLTIVKGGEMEVKIKKLDDSAVVPFYAHDSDAGLDLTATSKKYDEHGICYGTGLAISIPKGHVGYLFPRSSVSKKDISLANSVGVIDSGYLGEIILKFKPNIDWVLGRDEYEVGDKVGQLVIMPIPKIKLVLCDDLGTSDRGTGAFGSTDPITKSIEVNCGEQ